MSQPTKAEIEVALKTVNDLAIYAAIHNMFTTAVPELVKTTEWLATLPDPDPAPDQMTKEKLVNKMKHLRYQYELMSTEWKRRSAADDLKAHFDNQRVLLESFKQRYNFYLDKDEAGALKPIDWAEVEKLITTSYALNGNGYILAHSFMGIGGLSYMSGADGRFSVMVRDDAEAILIQELIDNARQVKANAKA